MPYGSISDDVRAFVEMRARQNNVIDRIILEADYCENGNEYPCDADCACEIPDFFRTVSIIVGGALDEEFSIISGGYEVNIADWISEHLSSEILGEDYWVIVSDYFGECVYTTLRDF